MPGNDLLSIDRVSLSYGGLRALNGLSLQVREGTITGVIGPNGAGKSSLFNCISGLARPDEGEIVFRGARIDRDPAHARIAKGLGRGFQEVRVLEHLSLLDNVLIGAQNVRGEKLLWAILGGKASREQEARNCRRALELLEWIGLASMADQRALHLSYGQQKLLGICQLLMAEPTLLLLDEPVAGVRRDLVSTIESRIRDIVAGGTTVLVIEHNMSFVWSMCDVVNVMVQGEVLVEGTPDEVRRDEAVISAYLGRPAGGER